MIYPSNDTPQPSLDQAIEAARTGQRDNAVRMLRQIVEREPHNSDAWMWLGGIAPDAHEQRSALERAVEIAPDNRRARRGLEWLRETQPQVFEESTDTVSDQQAVAEPTAPAQALALESDTSNRGVATDESGVARQETTTTADRDQRAGTVAETREEQPRMYNTGTASSEAATQPMPVQGGPVAADTRAPEQTARTPSTSAPQPHPLFADQDRRETEEMRVRPYAAEEQEYEPAPGANFARWLLIILWGLGLGAVGTIAAIFIASDPALVEQTIQNTFAQAGLGQPATAEIVRQWSIIIGVLIGIAIIALIVMIGLILRRRWAWGVNLLVALLIVAGSLALLIPFFQTGELTWNNPAVQIATWLAIFSLIVLFLSLASRRAFRRVRGEEEYGR
jgi:hypothetical protein